MIYIIVVILNHLCLLCYTKSYLNKPLVLTKPCGNVNGIEADGIYVFKGIPYAKPPVKELRWMLPQCLGKKDSSCWKGVFDASKYGSECFQKSLYGDKFSGDENCLYLNVYTPTLNRMANLPVMVWIHGGYLMIANASIQNYSPTPELVKTTNMVFVGMHYRLNGFGFMTLDLLSQRIGCNKSGNYGIADQIKALEWVKKNIKNFGGDPEQVTIYGQSSGGTSVYALLASPKAKGLFQRAWAQSGSPILNKTMEDASKDNLVFLERTGCKNVSCLLNLSPEEVYKALPMGIYPFWDMSDLIELPNKGGFNGALPVVDGDIIPKPIFETWEKGEGNDVPTLISTTAQEIDFWPDPKLPTWTWDTYNHTVAKHLDTFSKEITQQAMEFYPPLANITPEYQYSTIVTDARANCFTDVLTAKMASKYKSPVYRLITTSIPSTRVQFLDFPFKAAYAFHGWDSYAFYGAIPNVIKNPSQDDLAFQKVIQENIFHFAKTGKVKSDIWLPFPKTTALASNQITTVSQYHKEQCTFWLSNGFGSYSWIN